MDGLMMALGALPTLMRLARNGQVGLIDAHFGYPDGYAATLLARWLKVPSTITLRGTEHGHSAKPALRSRLQRGLRAATRVFSVSDSLRQIALTLGVPAERTRVIGNGVDLTNFRVLPRNESRRRLGLQEHARVLVSVGGLVERKGFHRVLECLPALRERFPDLHYVIAGGPSPEGDWTDKLREMVHALGLQQCVHFLGPVAPRDLSGPLSAADVFVLATRNEGWANVFLEAMACGLPVVTTRVGGNAEVVCRDDLGTVVPFGDATALREAIAAALLRDWDRSAIRRYAEANSWDERIAVLVEEFRALGNQREDAQAVRRVAA
jgi:glycosyltransferase involved in cell wall biosynthesis